MSFESVVVQDFNLAAEWFNGAFTKLQAVNAGSENAQKVQNAGQALGVAAQAAPALAEEIVNYALSLVPEGTQYAPLTDQLIDMIIAQLTAKKSTTVTAS